MRNKLLQIVIDFVLPKRCLSCSALVDEDHSICPKCWSGLTFLSSPYCDSCAFLFEISVSNELNLCAECTKEKYYFDKSRSSLIYDQFSKTLILQFKHNDATHLAKLFAKWMRRSSQDIIKQTDLFIPIPIHWQRLLSRKYNQAVLLANELAQITSIKSYNDIIHRVRHTAPQTGNKLHRQHNIRNVFAFNEKYIEFINKKSVTIVDDVHTSGATLNECAKLLKHYGAEKVYTITIARVARL